MDVTHIIEPLNDAQREAVTAEPGHLLVLAGAGSGKTRVLVHRIAWLLATNQATPWGVLAVTFTNKAAGEMRGRIEEMLGRPVGGMWVGTFHGLANRLLRQHWQDAGLPEGFQILDAEDQLRALRRVMRDLGLDEKDWPPKQAQWFINARKDDGLRPENLEPSDDPEAAQMQRVYQAYEEACARYGVVDFAELLLRAHELLCDRADVAAHYRERFAHLLVDEFQDTNAIQYAWVRHLAGESGELFCVGDDDQSIYGWRGARIENIQQFPRDFPNVRTVRLEQNYRSSGNILAAANALIANNQGRLGKNLWTEGSDGEPIHLYAAFNDLDEARYVVARIEQLVEEGDRREDCTILYRVSAQSRIFEEALLAAGVPYRVYGGLRFYERAEVKNALAYLRLALNRHDDPAFERVVNVPTRGIGARTLDILRARAREEGRSLWTVATELVGAKGLSARAASAVKAFLALVDGLEAGLGGRSLDEQVADAIARSGLGEMYRNDRTDRAQTRSENLAELVTAARQFAPEAGAEGEALGQFLAHAALEAGETQAGEWDDCVHLMTLHSAKGLEFPNVFLCGLEEGLFPHQRSFDDPSGIEEERRLCYVGMTRAQRRLYVSFAESRRLYREDRLQAPSRFLRELPAERVQEVRLRAKVARPAYAAPAPPRLQPRLAGAEVAGFQLGQRVAHPKFGEGVVLNYEGQGSHARVQVNFEASGSKWLVVAYAKLDAV